jgi:hypothetical protein
MAGQRYEEKYTKPELRRRLKDEIQQSDKGGKPGQWSARKSQLLVQEYEKQGGGYKQDRKDEAARSLEEWSDQNWQTRSGEGPARGDRITRRYLPEAVWNRLSEAEKREAEESKEAGAKAGEQYVSWTPAIKRAMAEAGYGPDEGDTEEPPQQALYEKAQALEISGRSKMSKAELKQAIEADTEGDTAGDADQTKTKEDLYEEARELQISGRSKMTKAELQQAIQKQKS